MPAVLAATVLVMAGGCSMVSYAPVAERGPWDDRAARESRPTVYRVKRGDTLYSIAFRYGLDYHDVARWNGIGAPYTIYPDQRLRLRSPPEQSASAERSDKPAPGSPDSERRKVSKTNKTSKTSPTTGAKRTTKWVWPVRAGRIVLAFDDADPNRKGIDISGREGQPVLAAAAGSVVYSGNGLSGYGELVIIKHNDELLSAYGYNRRRLVREGEEVDAGEQISEMGRSPRGQVRLHFEIRRQGEPRDPLAFVEPR